MKHGLGVAALLTLLGMIGCGGGTGTTKPAASEYQFKLGFMPKLVGIPYFNACKRGAEEAARELRIELTYNGPNKADVNPQIEMLNQWVAARSYDVLAVACNDPDRIAGVLKRAREKEIHVITFDADSQEDARAYFVNQATYEDVAQAMVDAMAEELEPKGTGKVGILTSSIQAPNQSQWAKRIKAYTRNKYPQMELLAETEHGEDRDLGITKAKALLAAEPELKGIIGLTSVAVPAAAEAVRQEGKKGKVKVVGVSTPKDMRDYVKDGTVNTVILWNPIDLGYLTVYVAALLRANLMADDCEIRAGRLGDIKVRNREVLLGKPMRFTRENIDQYDF